MRRWFEFLASLKLSVILLLVLSIVLAAGTIVESMHGTEEARKIYYAPWFFALQGFFGINIVFALIDRWPRNRWRIGFAVTHLSMLLIFVGALLTWTYKVEGRLPVWEGESSNLVYQGGPQSDLAPIELPFTVRVDSFEIDTYPGTRRPAMFRSRVVVVDPAAGETPAVIEMNRPMSYGGYSFFQSSYQIQGGREMTILQVSKDPGELVVFIGYTLLVLGMIVVLTTRLIEQAGRGRRKGATAAALAVLTCAGFCALAAPVEAAELPDAASVKELHGLPVQHDGRTMPFDTQARNAVRDVTGLRAWPGIDPVAMTLGWVLDPEGWRQEPIVRVRADVATVAGLAAGTRYASFAELVGNRALLDRFSAARARSQADEKLSPIDEHLLEVERRLVTLDDYFRGRALHALPGTGPNEDWRIASARSAGDLVALGRRLRAAGLANYPSPEEIGRELLYNEVRPSRIAWLLLVPAALAAAFAMGRKRVALRRIADALTVLGFLVVTWSVATRWQVAGRIPASNMYESMLFLGWGVALFGVVSVLLRNRMLVFNAAAMAGLSTALTDLLPMDSFIHPMPPVLSGTPWLAIHVPIIMVSYSVFAIVTFFGHLVVGVEIFAPARRDLAERWSQLLYWYTHVGSILLIAGILTGSIWAASSWGRYWGWDPKEVWSLVAFLAFMAILHARFDHQIHDFGVAVGSIAAFWTILMTYLGVNFVLAAGLHSYGFGSSNLVRILALVALVEIAYVGWGWVALRKRLAAAPA